MPWVEQGTYSFDNAAIAFDNATPFDEVGVRTRTLTGAHAAAQSLCFGWLRTWGGNWLGLRPFTMKTSCQKAEPQRRREGPMGTHGRLVRGY